MGDGKASHLNADFRERHEAESLGMSVEEYRDHLERIKEANKEESDESPNEYQQEKKSSDQIYHQDIIDEHEQADDTEYEIILEQNQDTIDLNENIDDELIQGYSKETVNEEIPETEVVPPKSQESNKEMIDLYDQKNLKDADFMSHNELKQGDTSSIEQNKAHKNGMISVADLNNNELVDSNSMDRLEIDYLSKDNLDANKLQNTEKTLSGKDLEGKEFDSNEKFRGDYFSPKDSIDYKINPEYHEDWVNANNATTCSLNENINGSIISNDSYLDNLTDKQKVNLEKLKDYRAEIPEVRNDTIMQKVITTSDYYKYIDENNPRTDVSGCASRAVDVAPFTNNAKQIYNEIRLDYNETVFKDVADSNGDVYVMRFNSDFCPSNEEYPKMDGSQPWNKPPCTGTGWTGSDSHLIPEYTYGKGQEITDGAIFKLNSNGEETIVAFWNHGRFKEIE